MKNWKKTKWGEVATLEYGKALRDYDEEDGTYPVFGTNGQIGWHEEPLVNRPGVIIGRKGAYRGVEYSDKPFCVIDTAFYLNLTTDKILDKWAYYQLKDFDINNIDSGTAIPSTSREAFYQIPVEIPPIEEQKKIVENLSAFDDLIENNTRRIEILEEMARRIYREWFVHLRYPGHEDDDPSTGSGQRLVDSGTELGEIPGGWEVKEFGELVEYERDRVKNEEVEEKVSVLGLGDMPKKSITLSEWENTDDIGSTKLRFKRDDILFGKIRPYFHKVGFAQTSGVCSSDIFVWRAKDPKDFVFALLTASSDKFVETATNSSSGTKMPRAKWDVLEKYQVAYPPEELLAKLNSLVGSSLEQIRTLSFQNKRLKETRDLLLPKLISGNIEIEEIPIS